MSSDWPAFPGTSRVRAGDKAWGDAGPLGLFRWLSDSAPCVAGPTGRRAAHTEPPAGAPLAGSDITSMSTPRSRQLPAGLYGAGPDRPGPPPAPPQCTHWPTVLGSGSPGPPRLHRAACPSIRSPDLGAPHQGTRGLRPGLHLLLPLSREASETGLGPSVAQWAPVGPFQYCLGPHRPQRSRKGPALPDPLLWWTPSLGRGPLLRGEVGRGSVVTAGPPGLVTPLPVRPLGPPLGSGGWPALCSQDPHLRESVGRPGAQAGQRLAQKPGFPEPLCVTRNPQQRGGRLCWVRGPQKSRGPQAWPQAQAGLTPLQAPRCHTAVQACEGLGFKAFAP